VRYVLASGSPRRKELLAKVVPEYEVIPAVGEEETSEVLPERIVEQLSYQKASEIFHKILTNSTETPVVIGADTVVSYKRGVLGKPADRTEAANMIRGFQGDSHAVYTGVTVFTLKDGKPFSFTFHEETIVDVAPMTEEEILSYVSTGEADDKAGAYGVQGLFGIFITGIKGDYYNVVGLPIARLYHELKNNGLL
jgi:septum formation protein